MAAAREPVFGWAVPRAHKRVAVYWWGKRKEGGMVPECWLATPMLPGKASGSRWV